MSLMRHKPCGEWTCEFENVEILVAEGSSYFPFFLEILWRRASRSVIPGNISERRQLNTQGGNSLLCRNTYFIIKINGEKMRSIANARVA